MASRTTARAGLSLGTSGHEEESRAYLQRRLHLVVLVSALAISLFFCVSLSFEIFTGNWTPAWLVTPQRIVHIVSLALDWGMFWLIARRRLTLRTLQALDILNLQVAFVTCLSIYALVYEEPGAQGIPGVVNIFIFLRAVIVPSTVRRTLVHGLPDARKRVVNRPLMRRLVEAMRQIGLEPSKASRIVGGYRLQHLVDEGEGYQEHHADNATIDGDTARVRSYLVPRQTLSASTGRRSAGGARTNLTMSPPRSIT